MQTATWRTLRILAGVWVAGLASGCIFEQPGGGSCSVGAEVFENGSSVPSGDSCNTCGCNDGAVICTLRFCEPEAVACGGRLGDTCGADEYCAYENGDCGFADGTSTCRVRPEVCDDIFAPVCGCDSVTYDNACSAAAAGTGFLNEGACAP